MTRLARRWLWITGLLALLIGAVAFPAIRHWDLLRNLPLLDGSTITIVPGIHLLGNLGPSAAYAVETSAGVILIDTGLDADARPLKTEMAKLGVDWKKIRGIFLTHVHGDHCGGAELLRDQTGATVYAGRRDVPILQAGAPQEAFFSIFRMPNHTPHPTTVDVALAGDESIQVGDVRIQVLDTPGHTPGSMCYLIERAGLRVLFSGDVIMRLGERPLGTYSTQLPPRYGGDAGSYLSSLKKLRVLPVPDLVLPGHPRANSAPHSPRLTEQQWTTMLATGIREMEQLAARFEADGADFLDGAPKQLLHNLYYLGEFHDAAVYVFFASSKIFVVDAPGGAGLTDFLTTRLRQLGQALDQPLVVLLTACGENETSGLSGLIEHSHIQVVASPEGVERVKHMCPPGTVVLSTDDLLREDSFAVTPLRLGGRGLAPVAYLAQWSNKTVLFSGKIPAAINQESLEQLQSELAESRPNALAFLASLKQLAGTNPDLWLPAVPSHGQNANVYDSSWRELLEKNYLVGTRSLHRQ